jgi:drug/metabolite transporter (DMT)-like permease
MPLIEAQAVRAVLLLTLVALVFTGVAFAGYAGFLVLAPYMPAAAAAAVVAFVFLAVAFSVAFVVRRRVHQPRSEPAAAQSSDAAAMALLAGMAKEKPLMAVLFAGLLGAAVTILQQKNRVN